MNVNEYNYFYNSVYLEECQDGDSSRTNKWVQFIKPPPANMKILDVGCGPGEHIKAWLENNEVHGVDIVDEYLYRSEKNGYFVHKCNCEECDLPFDDEYFDIVVCTDLFEHLFNPVCVIDKIVRVTKTGGLLLTSVPNHFHLQQCAAILKGDGLILKWGNHQRFDDWNYFHIKFFTSRSFEKFIENANFKIKEKLYDKFSSDMPYFFPGKFPWKIQNFLFALLKRIFFKKYPDLFVSDFPIIAEKVSNSDGNHLKMGRSMHGN